jgi:hypothetical protein
LYFERSKERKKEKERRRRVVDFRAVHFSAEFVVKSMM